MKAILFALFVSALLFQQVLNPNLLTEPMAAQYASNYANLMLQNRGFHSTKQGWRGEFGEGRWHMRYGPFSTAGWTVSVSFKADASDKKLEGSGFSVE